MILRTALIVLSLAAAIAACSPVAVLNATIPKSGYALHKNIAYGTHTRQMLDIYVPSERAKPMPVIVFFYGGSWQFGSKDEYLFLGQALASKGFVTVIADYRHYPEVYFPAFVEDGAQAFKWVHEHISAYGGNSDALFLSGHSAGAYISLMLTLNKTYLTAAGADPQWVKGAIGISGPYHFLPFTDKNIIALFSKVPDKQTQPINYVTPGNPPILLATGDNDDTVLPRNTLHLAARLKAYGNPVEQHVYDGIGHIGIMLSLARGFRSKTSLLEDITRFVEKTAPPKS